MGASHVEMGPTGATVHLLLAVVLPCYAHSFLVLQENRAQYDN
jgi:hypothetical protein